jgi:hypothetical protein
MFVDTYQEPYVARQIIMEGGRAGKKLLVEDDEEDNNMELAVNTEYASRFEVC